MKPFSLLLFLALLVQPAFAQRHFSCDSFCVTGIALDTTQAGILDITIYNGNMEHINYPMVEVVVNGDTVARQQGLYYYAQLGKTSLVHYAGTRMTSVPENFTCKVILIETNRDTCVLDYPCMVNDAGIAQVNANRELHIFPNPSKGLFQIDLPATRDARFRVWDLYGKSILQDRILSATFRLDLRGRAPGVYFLQVYSNGHWQAYPLVVEE